MALRILSTNKSIAVPSEAPMTSLQKALSGARPKATLLTVPTTKSVTLGVAGAPKPAAAVTLQKITNVGAPEAAAVNPIFIPPMRKSPTASNAASQETVASTPRLPMSATKQETTNVGATPFVAKKLAETPAEVIQVSVPVLKYSSVMDEVMSQAYVMPNDIEVLNQTPLTRQAMQLQIPQATTSPVPGSANADAGPPAGATSTGGSASTVASAPDLNTPEQPVGTTDVAEEAIDTVPAKAPGKAGLGASLIGGVVGALVGGPLGAAAGALLGSYFNSKTEA